MGKTKTKKLVKVVEEEKSEVIELKKEKSKEEQAIDLIKNIFNYKSRKFSFIFTDDEKFFVKAKEIAEFLEYNDTQQAISKNVNDKYKFTLEELIKLNNIYSVESKSGPVCQTGLTWNEKNTIYLTEPGLYQLIGKSRKTEAEAFQEYILETILPKLREKGSFSLIKKVILDTSFIKSFYDDNSISDYFKLNVVYLAVIGMFDGGLLIKFGKSERIFDRDYNEHRKTFGNQFKIVCIIHTDNNKEVEEIFKQTIKAKGLDRKISFNVKERTELFVTSENFTMDNAIDLMKSISEKNQLPIVKEKEHKIKELEYKFENDKEIVIEKEHTKQKELELKIKELDKDIEFKKMDMQIELKKLDLKKCEIENSHELNPNRKKGGKYTTEDRMKDHFEFTGNQNDKVLVSVVNNLFAEKFPEKLTVLRPLMIDLGAEKMRIKYKGKPSWNYTCVKIKN
jgi:prophage antirepressor-like protein